MVGQNGILCFGIGKNPRECVTFLTFVKKKLEKKKPDAVAWDDTTAQYIAKILPYASSLSGPVIELADVDAFKRKGVEKATKILKTEWEELQQKLRDFASTAANTERVYAAHYKFEPIVGATYFLYESAKGDFLSIIPPEQWSKKFVGAFRLTSDFKWEKVSTNTDVVP